MREQACVCLSVCTRKTGAVHYFGVKVLTTNTATGIHLDETQSVSGAVSRTRFCVSLVQHLHYGFDFFQAFSFCSAERQG